MQDNYILATIFMGFLATFLSRILPLLLFKKEPSKALLYIQKNMPLAIMVILVFYTFFSFDLARLGILSALILACFLTLFLQVLFKNAILSIVLSTLAYMGLLRILV